MRSLTVGVALVLVVTGGAQADPRDNLIEITGLVGYQFGGSGEFEVDSGPAWGDLASGPAVGGMLGLRVSDYGLAIVGYHYQRAEVDVEFSDGSLGSFDLNSGYLQVGGELEYPTHPRFMPFFGMTVGATHFTPDVSGSSTEWFFSATAFAGFKVPITKHIGLRTQLRMLATVIDGNSDVFCVLPGGCLVALDTDGVIQGDVMAGVYIAF